MEVKGKPPPYSHNFANVRETASKGVHVTATPHRVLKDSKTHVIKVAGNLPLKSIS
jgi:hypothetical protein